MIFSAAVFDIPITVGYTVTHFCECKGEVAQLVEQRTENPCVGGSIPFLATILRAQRSEE